LQAFFQHQRKSLIFPAKHPPSGYGETGLCATTGSPDKVLPSEGGAMDGDSIGTLWDSSDTPREASPHIARPLRRSPPPSRSPIPRFPRPAL